MGSRPGSGPPPGLTPSCCSFTFLSPVRLSRLGTPPRCPASWGVFGGFHAFHQPSESLVNPRIPNRQPASFHLQFRFYHLQKVLPPGRARPGLLLLLTLVPEQVFSLHWTFRSKFPEGPSRKRCSEMSDGLTLPQPRPCSLPVTPLPWGLFHCPGPMDSGSSYRRPPDTGTGRSKLSQEFPCLKHPWEPWVTTRGRGRGLEKERVELI